MVSTLTSLLNTATTYCGAVQVTVYWAVLPSTGRVPATGTLRIESDPCLMTPTCTRSLTVARSVRQVKTIGRALAGHSFFWKKKHFVFLPRCLVSVSLCLLCAMYVHTLYGVTHHLLPIGLLFHILDPAILAYRKSALCITVSVLFSGWLGTATRNNLLVTSHIYWRTQGGV
jgi:hypothetical protein